MKAQGGNQLQSHYSDEGREPPNISITQLLNVSPVLPGESADLYKISLQGLIQELEAKTVLQLYLAEKIHECVWWMRRYEQQKRLTLIQEMALLTNPLKMRDRDERQSHLQACMISDQLDDEAHKTIRSAGHTPESLLKAALEKRKLDIQYLSNQIAIQAKILSGFQASYEVAFNRKFNAERLRLQNQMISRDLNAIDAKQ